MNIRVVLDGCYTVLNVFRAVYDEDVSGVCFFTLDDDIVIVEMSYDTWFEVSSALMCRGFADFIRYNARLDD